MSKQTINVAKITVPQADEILLHRERLFRKLDAARNKRITWVSGPAGCGKTTLLSSYIGARDLSCLWYQVDGGDNDLATFFYYLGLAGKKAAPRKRKSLPPLTPEYLLGIPEFSRNFFQDFFSRLKPPAVVVFDNFHKVSEDAPLHASLIEGLSRIPEDITCILLSRTGPPAPYTRLKANRKMPVINWQDLRFTVGEFREIASVCYDAQPRADVVKLLHRKTDGWIAGFYLMLEDGDFVWDEEVTHNGREEIFHYFTSELFARLPEETRAFLLNTAYLPFINSSMAERISGISTAAAILSSLYRDNFFISRSLHPGAVYQYHQLFREFLLARAEERFSEKEKRQLQRRAASLLMEENLYDEAADLLRQAGDAEGLTGLIMVQGESLLSQGRNNILLNWLASLPSDVLHGNPWLLFWQGASLMAFNPPEATRCFERSFKLFQASKEPGPGLLLAYAGILESVYYSFDDFNKLRQWLSLLPELLTPDSSLPSDDMGAYIVSSIYSAMLFVLHPDAAKWEKLANVAVENTGNISRKMVILFNSLFYYFQIGSFLRVEEVFEQIKLISRPKEVPPFARLIGLMAELMHTFFTNREKQGDVIEEIVQQASQIADQSGVHSWDSWLFGFTAWTFILLGRLSEAKKYYARMESMASRMGRWDLSFFHYLRGYLALKQDNLSQAAASVDTALKLTLEAGDLRSHAQICFLKAEILFQQGAFDEAFACLNEARENSEKHGMRVLLSNYYIFKGNLYYRLGQDEEGGAAVQKANTLGREIGITYPSFVEKDLLAFCCAKALEHDIEKEYVLELIRANNLVIPGSCYQEGWPWPVKVFTLGRFEVLRQEQSVRCTGRAQQKPLELLKALLSLGGRQVEEATLTEAMWPEADGDMQHRSLNTTIHRVRKLLDCKEAIEVTDGKISLNNRCCWVDSWAFERLCGQAENAWKEKRCDEAAVLAEKALALYHDAFLARDTREPYVIHQREKLRSKFLRDVQQLAEHYENQGRLWEAVKYYEQGLAVDPLMEEFYQKEMSCLQRQGKTAEAIVLYGRCRNTLEKLLGVLPSETTETIYRNLMAGR